MRLFFCFLFSIVAISAIAQSERKIPIKPAPSWIKAYSYKEEAKDTANTSGGYFNLLYDDQYNIPEKETYHHYVMKILSEKGLENVTSISRVFDPSFQTLTFHSIDVIRDGKKINQLVLGKFEVMRRETSLDRLIYDGDLTTIFNLHDIQIGDIVEYSFSVKGANPNFKGKFSKLLYFDHSVPVGRVVCRLIVKSDVPFDLKKINLPPEAQITKAGGQTVYEWDNEDVPPVLSDESTPGWYDPYKHVQVGNFGSWSDLSLWADQLYKMDEVPKGLLDRIPGIQKENKDEAIRKIIRFVQDEVHYLSFSDGIHGMKPHSPSLILSQRFGDCKDKSVLLASLLTELGVESNPVLVNTSYGKTLPDYLASPTLFDHCIVQFKLRDSTYWIDPTITLQRGKLNELYFPSYYNGVVINKSAKGLVELPASKAATFSTEEKFYLDSIGGGAKFTITTTYTRHEADNIREYLTSNSLNEIEKQYLNFYATDYPEIQKGSPFKWSDNQEKNIIVSEENYKISNFWTYDSAASQYTATVYPRNLSSYLYKPQTKIRQDPYTLKFPLDISQQMTLHMPEEWTINPRMKNIESAGFSYHSKIRYDDKKIELMYHYQSKKSYLEGSEVKEYISKLDEVFSDLNFSVSYKKGTPANTAFNYPFLIILFVFIVGFWFAFKKAYEWDPEPIESPERHSSIGGWLVLPAIGFCLNPLRVIYQFTLPDSDAYFSYYTWQILADPAYAGYRPAFGITILAELIANFFLLMFGAFLLVIFFQRRSSVPVMTAIFLSYSLALVVVDSVATSLLGFENDTEDAKTIVKAIVVAAIWIPYFLVSNRSKGTFRVRHRLPPGIYQVKY